MLLLLFFPLSSSFIPQSNQSLLHPVASFWLQTHPYSHCHVFPILRLNHPPWHCTEMCWVAFFVSRGLPRLEAKGLWRFIWFPFVQHSRRRKRKERRCCPPAALLKIAGPGLPASLKVTSLSPTAANMSQMTRFGTFLRVQRQQRAWRKAGCSLPSSAPGCTWSLFSILVTHPGSSPGCQGVTALVGSLQLERWSWNILTPFLPCWLVHRAWPPSGFLFLFLIFKKYFSNYFLNFYF